MACFGSKPLRRKGSEQNDTHDMKEEENLSKRGRKKEQNKHLRKGTRGSGEEGSSEHREMKKKNNNNKFKKHHKYEGMDELSKKKKESQKLTKSDDPSKRQITLRKRVDPETAKYFSEIAKLFEGNEIELEDRPAICGNALEETRGKEVELATDMIISHTLQILLEGCDLELLCGFLQNCAAEFPSIAMDKFGSHVAETALKSLAIHLQDDGSISMIGDTLTKICEMVVLDAANIMCCCYGSHVLRSILCLCKGVPVGTLEEFHVTKSSAVLAERLNCTSSQSTGKSTENCHRSFIDVFNFLVREMLIHAKDQMKTLRVNKYGSFVLQTVLKLLVGDDQELLHAILIILNCEKENSVLGNFIEPETKQEIIQSLDDTAFSHLFEVIIEAAPEFLYNEFLKEVFEGSLFEISSLQCGNFVVQTLVCSAKTKDQVNLVWEELGAKFKDLLEIGKSGVVASVLAACQRIQFHVHECCEALAAAVSSEFTSTACLVPHILFLDSYLRQKSSWKWPTGDKMHTLGCLMLQTVFRCSKKFIQPYIDSIASMDADHLSGTAKDAGGSRVIETFLSSEASAKQKFEVITKLRDHFGELAKHPSSSFTVEKCFAASNVTLKEAIASELLAEQAELSKTKHGPYLLKKLDIDGYSRRPEQWKRSQASRETIYKEFQAAFGSNAQLQEQPGQSQKPSNKKKREDEKANNESSSAPSLDSEFPGLESSMAKLGIPVDNRGLKRERPVDSAGVKDFGNKRFLSNSKKATPFLRNPGKRKLSASELSDFGGKKAQKISGKMKSSNELADLAGKRSLSTGDVRKLFTPATLNEMKHSAKEKKPFLRNQRR